MQQSDNVKVVSKYSRLLSHSKLLAEPLCRLISDVHLDVGDAHPRAPADETPRKLEADALGTPGHDGPLVSDRKPHLVTCTLLCAAWYTENSSSVFARPVLPPKQDYSCGRVKILMNSNSSIQ